MPRLILMRHGNTFEEGETPLQVGARTDLPLTAFGREQAKKMAALLKSDPPKAIFAGELKRQRESAEIIAQELGIKVECVPALQEIDYGLWESLSAETIARRWPKEYAEWNQDAKWQAHIFQKTFEGHLQKLQEWFLSLRRSFENQRIFGVTSNGILRFFKNEKVKTGHYCELDLKSDPIKICSWNKSPSI